MTDLEEAYRAGFQFGKSAGFVSGTAFGVCMTAVSAISIALILFLLKK